VKQNVTLRIASVLSLLLLTIHLADDVVRGMFPPGIEVFYAGLASGALLYGILALADRRSGLVVMLFVSLFAMAMPFLHTRGAGLAKSAASSGGFFFVWTLIALGMTGAFSFILSLIAFGPRRSGEPRQ